MIDLRAFGKDGSMLANLERECGELGSRVVHECPGRDVQPFDGNSLVFLGRPIELNRLQRVRVRLGSAGSRRNAKLRPHLLHLMRAPSIVGGISPRSPHEEEAT